MTDDTEGRNFIEFHKWCLVEERKGRYFHSRDEYEIVKAGWKAALQWVLNEGVDDWLEDTIKEELNAKT